MALTAEQSADGWIEHDGGPCPENADAIIIPLYRSDADPTKGIRRTYGMAWQFVWQHDGADDDIIAYRKGPTS